MHRGGRAKSKRKTLQVHAKRRMYARYGIVLTQQAKEEVVKAIQAGDGVATFIEKQSIRVSVWDVPLEGQVVRVVYDKQRKEVVTVLPPGGEDTSICSLIQPDQLSVE